MLIPDIANPFYGKAVRGAEHELRNSGYSLILASTYNSRDEQARVLSVFRAKQLDELLIFMAAGGEEDAKKLLEWNKPAVFLGREPRFAADSVTADNIKVGRLATEHLVKRGHKRIAIIIGQLVLRVSQDRVDGWKRVLKKHKLSAPGNYILEGDWTEDSGHHGTHELLALDPPPTAVFCSNFLVMAGALRALKERGLRCPGDVELVSADDSTWLDVFQPPITTVATPSYEIGMEGARLLLRRIKKKAGEHVERIVLQPKLIART